MLLTKAMNALCILVGNEPGKGALNSKQDSQNSKRAFVREENR
jgi:hypothetical protein